MEYRSRSTIFSSVNNGSNVNNLCLDNQNIDSVNSSGHGNHSSSIGWMGQYSFIGSSHNPIDLQELNAEHGWLPSPYVNIETSQNLEELHAGWVAPSESITSDAVPPKRDLNVAHEDNDENIGREMEAGYLNQTARLEGIAGTFDINTRQRTNPGSEDFQFSRMPSSVHVGSTSQISISNSSVPPVVPASGSDALWQQENSGYIAISNPVQSVLVPGPENGFVDQLPPPPWFPQIGFAVGVSLSPTPGFPLRNLAEGYAERRLNIVDNSMTRLSGLVSGGQIGYHQAASSTSVTMRGMLESRPGNLRAVQAHPSPRVLMMRAGHNALIPPTLPLLVQFIPDQQRTRLVHHALEIRQWAHGAALHHQDGMVVGPMFYEPDVLGLSEEAVLGGIKPHMYQSMKLGLPVEEESCCVCLEKYVDGEELGKLDCGHEFHFNCIKTWLMEKNSCPICRKVALAI